MANDNEYEPEAAPLDENLPESRRQVLERNPEDCRCRRCGKPVNGRRRNGYCSDACRLADGRDKTKRRRLELLDTISRAVEELKETEKQVTS
jgi:hypothetical protein